MLGTIVIVAILSLLAGVGVGRFLLKMLLKNKFKELDKKGKHIIKEAQLKADTLVNEKLHTSKEHFLKLRTEFEEESSKKKNIIITNENKVKQREVAVNKQMEQLTRREQEIDQLQESLQEQNQHIKKRKEEASEVIKQQLQKLESIAGLTQNQAREDMMELIKRETESKANSQIKEIIEEAKLRANKEAKKIVIQTIQRTAAECAIENCVSVFHLESDDLKGKIIGREGRNIRALENLTGIELIVDDTPEAIIISGFDPVRREIARLSMQRLVTDGRIHPARIEEVVAKTTKDIEEEIIDIGEKTAIELGIHGLHPELIRLVGRMRFRSSYGQNLLHHSKEVARLCATMASELGLNAKLAKRAGLLHDIGKVCTDQPELPHALLGMELAKKYKEHPEICNAIGAHHDEVEMTSIISPLIQICDSISGSRPGARREVMDSYIKRLQDLEALALSFDGVLKCFAIQAGRELRVVVDSDNVSDDTAGNLAYEISNRIEKEMQYPGQIRVTVIRETRAVSVAK